eukprot:scaffold3141_cov195-Cylindrotheca_fusiformis.AAC.1
MRMVPHNHPFTIEDGEAGMVVGNNRPARIEGTLQGSTYSVDKGWKARESIPRSSFATIDQTSEAGMWFATIIGECKVVM